MEPDTLLWQQKNYIFVVFSSCSISVSSFTWFWQMMSELQGTFRHWINTNPTCEVTIFVKGAQNAQFSFHILPQNSRDFESSYLLNGSRHWQTVKSLLLSFKQSFTLANKKWSKILIHRGPLRFLSSLIGCSENRNTIKFSSLKNEVRPGHDCH